MRVVVVPSWYPSHQHDTGGIFFREQARALARAGLDVEVLSPRRVTLKRLIDWTIPEPLEPLVERRATYLGPPRSPWLDDRLWLLSLQRLYEAYCRRRGAPDILHVHSLQPAGRLCTSLPARVRVLTEHSTEFQGPSASQVAAVCASSASRYDVRIAVSIRFAEQLTHLMPAGAPWRYVPNLVDTDYFQPAQGRPAPIRLLTVSNLVSHKRVDWIIRAFDKVFTDSTALLAIGGGGPEEASLRALAAQSRAARRISFLGPLSRADVKAELDRSSAVVLASRLETFGVVLIEALSMGRPVLATNAGGPASIVREFNGILSDVGDFDAYCDAMRAFQIRLPHFDGIGIRRDCVARFSERAVAAQLIAVYRELLEDAAPPR